MSPTVTPHPLLDLAALHVQLPGPLGELSAPDSLTALLAVDAPAPYRSSDGVRAAVRRLLRHGGFKPSGRNKPASEYLLKVAQGDGLRSINLVVDLGNVVSLHTGLPISVVDVARATEPLTVDVAPAGARFVFNASGQEIDVGGLLGLADAHGPCANAVKDSQRTKTDATTTEALVLIWGTVEIPGRTRDAARFFQRLGQEAGAEVMLA